VQLNGIVQTNNFQHIGFAALMSLKHNILANYASQFYVAAIGIVMVPMYVRYMGGEAYGLVGFFAVLQAWFQLLDMGLTPTLARETARVSRSGEGDPFELRRLLRILEGIFIVIAILGAGALIGGSHLIANNWLKVQQLPATEVEHAIMLMAAVVALRWIGGLYRGAISGFERLVWLSGVNIAVATARSVLVVPYLMFVGASPTHFFAYQLAVALAETLLLAMQTYRLLPKMIPGKAMGRGFAPLYGVLRFSVSMCIANVVWILGMQADKVALSRLLPLEEYAYFTLAALMASGISLLASPISVPLMPRLTRLFADGDHTGLIGLYREATQLLSVIVIPAVLVMAFFPGQVLWIWTGNAEIVQRCAPLLRLYALGNGIAAFGAFPYYLQFAKGNLKLHVIGTVIFAAFLIPAVVLATKEYGVIGAGYAWLAANLIYFLFWLPVVHGNFAQGLHVRWVSQDVGLIVLWSAIAATLIFWSVDLPKMRSQAAFGICVISAILLIVSVASSSQMRRKIATRWQSRFVV
jgi:O-antigen/teichoic acid export membrane protein